MKKLGISKLLEETIPVREERKDRARKAAEKAAKEEAIIRAEREKKLRAEAATWVEKQLPVKIREAILAGQTKVQICTDRGNGLHEIDKYILEHLRQLSDIQVTSEWYAGTGRYDEGYGWDESYNTYYVEWKEK